MALPATVYRFHVAVADVDRGVYETLDLRVARHPSETMRYLLARVLAYCLCYEEGLVFTRGLAAPDEPALWSRGPGGELSTWIDVGTPAAERLHRAAKAARRVVVVTHQDPALLRKAVRGQTVHRAEAIEVLALEPALLDALAGTAERTTRWELLSTGGRLYVTVGGTTIEGACTRHSLVDE
jgi:uncharacterized protein YaeQ